MLVATQSFSCEYDGQTIAVHRGSTYVHEDHELARRYPHRFAPETETRASVNGRAAAYRRGRWPKN
jgi:hypothetical protein